MADTKAEFEHVIGLCREVFLKKMSDYGASWRLMRPESLTDQIFIKARRIRTLEVKKESKVGEGIYPEFMGMANYGIMALIQLELGYADKVDIDEKRATELYDHYMRITTELMYNKNSDYDEAWRYMRVNSYTDIILTKLERIKQQACKKMQYTEAETVNKQCNTVCYRVKPQCEARCFLKAEEVSAYNRYQVAEPAAEECTEYH